MRQLCVFCSILLFSMVSRAGFVEIGASGQYRSSYVNEFNYSRTQALTASLAYYFWEMSAIEFSYTNGVNQTFGKTANDENFIATTTFELAGADLILSLAGRQAPFRPYFKVGASYQRKKITFEQTYFPTYTREIYGWAPTVGAGFKLMVTQSLSLKIGCDAWASPEETNRFDFAASAGFSWLF
jgi:hypothetical protein